MPGIVVTMESAGFSREQFEALTQKLGVASQPPPGGRFRAAGPIAGGWRVVSGWDSREAFERFRDEKLMPAMQQAGGQPVRIEIWPVDEIQAAS